VKKLKDKCMRIFILDDSEERLIIFRKKFIGHDVITVKTAKDAISCLQGREKFDLICLDHDLGDKYYEPSGPGTGYEVAQWLERNEDKQANHIIIHSFNPIGALNMARIIPNAKIIPGFWKYDAI